MYKMYERNLIQFWLNPAWNHLYIWRIDFPSGHLTRIGRLIIKIGGTKIIGNPLFTNSPNPHNEILFTDHIKHILKDIKHTLHIKLKREIELFEGAESYISNIYFKYTNRAFLAFGILFGILLLLFIKLLLWLLILIIF